MSEKQTHVGQRLSNRSFSIEEKRDYCLASEKSGLSQVAFCKANGISKSSLYKWQGEFKKNGDHEGFSPLVLAEPPTMKQENTIQIELRFPNQLQLCIAMPDHHLVSFIQELSHATTVIR